MFNFEGGRDVQGTRDGGEGVRGRMSPIKGRNGRDLSRARFQSVAHSLFWYICFAVISSV